MLLEVKNLSLSFETSGGVIRVLDRVSFKVEQGQTLGIVGESGSGKSVTSLALMGLLAHNARIEGGEVFFHGVDLLKMTPRERRKKTASGMAMIFQDPMTSLNPTLTVGYQLCEVLERFEPNRSKQRLMAQKLLEEVGIPEARKRLDAYSYELSGGMCQRVMVAMALAGRPKLLIADEPTTALDVTIQAQIIKLLQKVQKEHQMGMVLISHDLGVIAQASEHVLVMYAGQVMEYGLKESLIRHPEHPYTLGLLKSIPAAQKLQFRQRLSTLPGLVPDLRHRPQGCQFNPRCPRVQDKCRAEEPKLTGQNQLYRCFFPVSGDPLLVKEAP